MTPWQEFKNIKRYFNVINKNSTIIDPYRVLNFNYKKNRSFNYFTLGRKII